MQHQQIIFDGTPSHPNAIQISGIIATKGVAFSSPDAALLLNLPGFRLCEESPVAVSSSGKVSPVKKATPKAKAVKNGSDHKGRDADESPSVPGGSGD